MLQQVAYVKEVWKKTTKKSVTVITLIDLFKFLHENLITVNPNITLE